jgi:hypothetical protein
MNTATGLIAVPALLLLVSCASSGSSANGWTNTSLGEAQRQQVLDRCLEQARAAETTYYDEHSRGDANSASPFINNLKVRQRSVAARSQSYEACLLAAGFSRQP